MGLSLTSACGSFFTMKGKNEACLLNLKLKADKQGWDMEEFTVSFQTESDNGEKESSLFHFFKRWRPATCCYSAQRKLLFQLKCAYAWCSLCLSLAQTDTVAGKNMDRTYSFFAYKLCVYIYISCYIKRLLTQMPA